MPREVDPAQCRAAAALERWPVDTARQADAVEERRDAPISGGGLADQNRGAALAQELLEARLLRRAARARVVDERDRDERAARAQQRAARAARC